MIAGLHGVVFHKGFDKIVIDVNGVRYQCSISLTTHAATPEVGENVEIFVHTHVREDALLLFGFSTLEEKDIFLALNSVSGIGPKLALTILSGLPVRDLSQTVINGDSVGLTKIPGVGKKTAERIIVDLKDKLSKMTSLEAQEITQSTNFTQENELVSALENLGYKPKKISSVVSKLSKQMPEGTSLEELIRSALREM